MPFDFRKEYKEFYLPRGEPAIVNVPTMRYVAVRGAGDPNAAESGYQQAVAVLYAVSYTIKMSYLGDRRMDGYFAYVVPPLEGFWRQDGVDGMDYGKKERFSWISVIRLPDFVTQADFDWAVGEATRKKKMDCTRAEFVTLTEGLCVQIMHLGSFDDEPASVQRMDAFLAENGYANDFSDARMHHEIYLSDPRKVETSRLKTVIRHPVKQL